MKKRIPAFKFILVAIFILVAATLFIILFQEEKQNVPISAQSYPSGFRQVEVVKGLNQPTAMEIAQDGRIFVAEKGGRLRVVKNGSLVQQPFATVQVKTDGERGLLGITVDPDFLSNGYVYIYYTDSGRSVNKVVRFTADPSNTDKALAGSETVILDNIPSASGYHNGGALHFGTDGKLYIAVGEGHTTSNSQSMNTLAGKLLRINKDGSVPEDNPFYTNASGINRAIWALGFRNPYTFAVNPTNGKIFVNDVGQRTFEEINDIQKGGNYGWPACEGNCNRGHVNPIHAYGRNVGAAITGGAFYTGNLYPAEYQGNYFFADFMSDWIKRLNTSNNQVTNFVSNLDSPVDLRMGKDGMLYYLAYGSGTVYRIQYGSGPISTPGTGATGTTDAGQITAVITKPTANSRYSAGETISYEGTATDSVDGVLPESAFRWKVETHHVDHTHPFLDWTTGKRSGSFQTSVIGENHESIRYRIYMSVTNSRNQTKEVTMDVYPNNSTMEFKTDPPGLELTIDGQPRRAPFTITGVAGFKREIGAAESQTLNNKKYFFRSWSDNGAATHAINSPAQSTVYTATYLETVVTPTHFCLGSCPTGAIPPLPDIPESPDNPQNPQPSVNANPTAVVNQPNNPLPTINALLSSVPPDTTSPQSPQLTGFINDMITQLNSLLAQASSLPTHLSNAVRQAITDLEKLLGRTPQNPNQNPPAPTSPPSSSNPTTPPKNPDTSSGGGKKFTGTPQKWWCRREEGGNRESCIRFLDHINFGGRVGRDYNSCGYSKGKTETCCTLWPQDNACR